MEPVSINKHSSKNDNSFYRFRNEFVKQIQKLSGKTWTDFNIHDPGITIMEQVCYALSDLLLRTEYSVEDFLTNRKGEIDYEYHGLYKPEEIFPNAPVSLSDYRKLIFDQIREIKNVLIKPAAFNEERKSLPLYDISVILKDHFYENESHMVLIQKEVTEKINTLFLKHRNFGEDIREIEIIEPQVIKVSADIELSSTRTASVILAEIYAKLQDSFSITMDQIHYTSAVKKLKLSQEELFTGPILENGYIPEEALDTLNKKPTEYSILNTLLQIEGVSQINNLTITFPEMKSPACEIMSYLMKIPDSKEELKIRLFSGSRELDIDINEVKLEHLKFVNNSSFSADSSESLSKLFPLPEGTYRNFRDYTSVQESFPSLYGLGAMGSAGVAFNYTYFKQAGKLRSSGMNENEISSYVSKMVQNQIKQLKGYLLFFDHLLYAFCADCESIKDLFSVSTADTSSYSRVVLDSTIIPNIEDLYENNDTNELLSKINAIMNKFDNFHERKGRVIDYLLSLYGTKMNQKRLTHFLRNIDGITYKSSEHISDAEELLNNKIYFLKNFPELSKNRSRGINYTAVSSLEEARCHSITGVQKQVASLMGLDAMCPGKEHSFRKEFFYVVENLLLRPLEERELHEIEYQFFNHRVSVVLPEECGRFQLENFRNLLEERFSENCPAHTYPEFFWLPQEEFLQFETLYKTFLEKKCKYNPGEAADYSELDRAAENLKRFLIEQHRIRSPHYSLFSIYWE